MKRQKRLTSVRCRVGGVALSAALLAVTLASVEPTAASFAKSFLGAVHEAGPGRADAVTDFLYELTDELEARITICALFESSRTRTKGTIEGLIWVLRPDQTGEQCSIPPLEIVRGQALICCQTGSPDPYPAGTVVAGELRKQGLPKMRARHSATTQVEVFDGRLPASATATAIRVERSPRLQSLLTKPIIAIARETLVQPE